MIKIINNLKLYFLLISVISIFFSYLYYSKNQTSNILVENSYRIKIKVLSFISDEKALHSKIAETFSYFFFWENVDELINQELATNLKSKKKLKLKSTYSANTLKSDVSNYIDLKVNNSISKNNFSNKIIIENNEIIKFILPIVLNNFLINETEKLQINNQKNLKNIQDYFNYKKSSEIDEIAKLNYYNIYENQKLIEILKKDYIDNSKTIQLEFIGTNIKNPQKKILFQSISIFVLIFFSGLLGRSLINK